MAVPVIFSTGSLYPFGLERIYAWISETGYDGVEIMMDERWDTHQEDYLRGLHERHGVPILSLHPPLRRGAWGVGPEETLVRVARLASTMEVPGKGRLPLKPFPAALGRAVIPMP
jgi:sugar phosphate isomerase/epimerase